MSIFYITIIVIVIIIVLAILYYYYRSCFTDNAAIYYSPKSFHVENKNREIRSIPSVTILDSRIVSDNSIPSNRIIVDNSIPSDRIIPSNRIVVDNSIPSDRIITNNSSDNAEGYKGKGFKSKGEEACRNYLEMLFGVKFSTVRPEFLKNPETERCMELDGYNEALGLAFEYHGEQHYTYPNFFHKSRDEFIAQIRRDIFKSKICVIMGIKLLIIPYTVRNSELPKYINMKLKELGVTI